MLLILLLILLISDFGLITFIHIPHQTDQQSLQQYRVCDSKSCAVPRNETPIHITEIFPIVIVKKKFLEAYIFRNKRFNKLIRICN